MRHVMTIPNARLAQPGSTLVTRFVPSVQYFNTLLETAVHPVAPSVLAVIRDQISVQAASILSLSPMATALVLRKPSFSSASVKLVAAHVRPVSMATSVRHAHLDLKKAQHSAFCVLAMSIFKVTNVSRVAISARDVAVAQISALNVQLHHLYKMEPVVVQPPLSFSVVS